MGFTWRRTRACQSGRASFGGVQTLLLFEEFFVQLFYEFLKPNGISLYLDLVAEFLPAL